MSDYKLVPVEPTPEMVEAAEDAYMPFGDMDLALRMAILAAPAVQGEPVGWQFYQDGKWWNGDDRIKDHRKNTEAAGVPVRDVYAAPQPAEQQPSLLDDDSLAHQIGEIGNQIHNLGCEYQNDEELADRLAEIAHLLWKLQQSATISKQQPVPDVAGLVEALSIARDYVFSSLEEKKMALAGYPQMWRCEQDDLAMIDATLSAYRKETSHDK